MPETDAAAPGFGRFARSVSTHGGGKVIASLISALWMVVAVRELSTAAFGDLAVLVAVGAFMIIVGDLGYPFLLADAVSRAGAMSRQTLRFVAERRVLVGLVGAAVGAVAYLIAASDKNPLVPLVFGVSIIATIVHSSMAAGLRGLGSFGVEAANDIASRVGVFVLGWIVLNAGGGVLGAAAVYALADLVSLAVVWVALRPRLATRDDIELGLLTLRRTWPLSTGRVLGALYNRGDTWLLSTLRSSTDAAVYAAPYRILEGLVLLPRSAGAVAVTHEGETARAGRRSWAPWRLALTVAGGMTVVVVPLMVFSTTIVTTLFGSDYESSGPVFAVLAASAVPGSVVAILSPLGGLNRRHAFAGVMFGAVAASLAANLVVIPLAGPIGAAWVNLTLQGALAASMLGMFGSVSPNRVVKPGVDPPERPPGS
jgi:O-antigen/teichoic acid export membrane protein